jgi:hypothetical protein
MQSIHSYDFDSKIFECVDDALSTLGKDQKELLRLRLKNRHYLPMKNVALAPVTLEQSLNELLGTSVSTSVVSHILENISRTFGIHIANDSDLPLAFETARKVARGSSRKSDRVTRLAKNTSSSLIVESKRRSIRVSFRLPSPAST